MNGMNLNPKFCQCCGMPMGDTDELYGTNADGSKNEDYCKYCFENGAFTFHGTMEEMIEVCVPHMVEANPGMRVSRQSPNIRTSAAVCLAALCRDKMAAAGFICSLVITIISFVI